MTINGDPTVIGWATAAVYLIAAAVVWNQASRTTLDCFQSVAWRLLAIFLAALGLNKELDLHDILLHRFLPLTGPNPPLPMYRFIFACAVIGLVAILVAAFWGRKRLRGFALPVIGLSFIFGYGFARVMELAQVDEFFHFHLDKNPILDCFEIIGALTIIAGAWALRAQSMRKRSLYLHSEQ